MQCYTSDFQLKAGEKTKRKSCNRSPGKAKAKDPLRCVKGLEDLPVKTRQFLIGTVLHPHTVGLCLCAVDGGAVFFGSLVLMIGYLHVWFRFVASPLPLTPISKVVISKFLLSGTSSQ